MKRNLFILLPLLVFGLLLAGCGGMGKDAGCEITVTTSPSEAVIVHNGKQMQASPVTLKGLEPGTHLLLARKEGFRDERKTISLLPRQKAAVHLKLEPLFGLVLVRSNPEGAEVDVSGAFRGKTPLLIPDFPLGEHRVKLQLDGYVEKEVEVTCDDRTPQSIFVDLSSDSASVAITSDPSGAAVFVNGSPRGNTPCVLDQIPAGKAGVELKLDGFYPYREKMVLHAGQRYEINSQLRPMPGTLRAVSVPAGARVYLDNQYRGDAPLTVNDLEPGSYRLRVELTGYAPSARTIEITSTDSPVEEFRLAKNSGMIEVVTEPANVKIYIDGEYRGRTKSGNTDVVSEPFTVDLLSEGEHTLQLTLRGYMSVKRRVGVKANEIQAQHEKMERLFIPDTIVRTGDGAGDKLDGVLIARHPNGDVELEVRPGVIVKIPAGDIVQISKIGAESRE
ncbi:MAG: PEGA domain-containing protein [Verrucomicrobia bacterium]|nr:PEGA domain-containing protein [Verrucomicrobiota bacterium]